MMYLAANSGGQWVQLSYETHGGKLLHFREDKACLASIKAGWEPSERLAGSANIGFPNNRSADEGMGEFGGRKKKEFNI